MAVFDKSKPKWTVAFQNVQVAGNDVNRAPALLCPSMRFCAPLNAYLNSSWAGSGSFLQVEAAPRDPRDPAAWRPSHPVSCSSQLLPLPVPSAASPPALYYCAPTPPPPLLLLLRALFPRFLTCRGFHSTRSKEPNCTLFSFLHCFLRRLQFKISLDIASNTGMSTCCALVFNFKFNVDIMTVLQQRSAGSRLQ